MRVLHVIDDLDPAQGGPPVVVRALAAAQARHGLVPEIVTLGPAAEGPAGVPVRLVARPGVGGVFGFPPAPELAALVRTADVVQTHGVWDPLILAAAAAARRAGVPHVLTPHGMLHPWSLAQKRWKKRLALAVLVRRVLTRAAAVHALNEAEAGYVRDLGVPAAAVRVVPNGVHLAEVDAAPAAARPPAALVPVGGRRYMLFLSRLHYKKGLDLLAGAFAGVARAHPDVQLVVAGPDGGARGDFEARVAALGLGARVHVVGPLYGAEKWAALAGAACFCLPSRQEGFSMAILEALACRVPAVISESCHFPEVAAAGAGVETPLDPAALAAGLGRVLADPAGAAAMGAAGRQLVEERYTWDRVADECARMYAAVRAAGSVPAPARRP